MVGNQDPSQKIGKGRDLQLKERKKLHCRGHSTGQCEERLLAESYDKENLSAAKSPSVTPSYSVNRSFSLPSPDACGTVPNANLQSNPRVHHC